MWHAQGPRPPLCLCLIYKYRDVSMDGLALSVFADALTLTLAALSADSLARCFTWHGGLRLPLWPARVEGGSGI